MINGERIGESSKSSSSVIACVDRLDELSSPWLEDRGSDVCDLGSPSSYSSCGESEFERYCSANSVLGTASLCSSVGTCNEFLGSDFGSGRILGFVTSSGNRGGVVVSESLDCLSDGGNEFREENGGLGESVFSDFRNGSLLGSDVNSSSFRANYEEDIDETLKELGIGGGSKSLWSPQRNFQSGRGFCEENNGTNEMSAELGSVSGLLHVGVANDNVDLPLLTDESRQCLSSGYQENPLSMMDMCEDKDANSPIEHTHDSLIFRDRQLILEKFVQTDGRGTGAVQEGEEETSLRCEHLDVEDSSLDYGTDDDDRDCAERRNLQYLKETKPQNENVLLMNSVVAFGCDDWDDYMQETEGNDMAPLLLEKPLNQQEEHKETEKTHLGILGSSLRSHVDTLFPEDIEQDEDVRDIPIASYQVHDINESAENIKGSLVGNFLVEKELPAQNIQAETHYTDKDSDAAESHLTNKVGAHESKLQCIYSEEPVGLNEDDILKIELSGISDLPLDPLSAMKGSQLQSSATEAFQDKESGLCEEQKLSVPLSLAGNSHHISVMQIAKNSAASIHLDKVCLAPAEVEKLDTDEFYDEMVHEMEEILLDSGRPHGAQISYSSQRSSSQLSQSLRDGGSTASTSGTDDAYPPVPYPLKIDWVEVVGAKQKRGDVSFGERLVGVKEYTVYVIRVWSGTDQWDVERRYRDFFTLYRQLKTLFTDRGCRLPSPWSSIDSESRKIFGNASPNVISDRSMLLQDCIRSILSGSPFGTPSSLVWFLSPCKPLSSSLSMNTMVPHSMRRFAQGDKSTSSFSGETLSEGASALGKTISLLVEIKPRKSVEQLLEEQFYICAGCHRRLDTGKSLMQELVHTFGWGKPRLCEYTGQLFCASCHTNDTAVLPARVLHYWDFSLYPVSQLAKAYLESIYDQDLPADVHVSVGADFINGPMVQVESVDLMNPSVDRTCPRNNLNIFGHGFSMAESYRLVSMQLHIPYPMCKIQAFHIVGFTLGKTTPSGGPVCETNDQLEELGQYSNHHNEWIGLLYGQVIDKVGPAEYMVCMWQCAISTHDLLEIGAEGVYVTRMKIAPMLCVSAVNPFLFSKVPTLLHVMGIRKKIRAMLPCLQCPFRRSIQRGLGSRRYLLENNEFFALRELVDLSRGAFAALPALVETVSAKILEHITQQCLVCCDVGIPCCARQACEDPASLIFPFQEAEITRCGSCDSVFHKSCFEKLATCPCSTAEVSERLSPIEEGKHKDINKTEEVLDISVTKPDSKLPVGIFSDLWRPRKNNPVILMGSLPSTAL